jgi:hypothetical protein
MTDEDQKMDDERGNCKRCGHPFGPHVIIAFDVNDFGKGGLMRCPVDACDCESTVSFNLKPS